MECALIVFVKKSSMARTCLHHEASEIVNLMLLFSDNVNSMKLGISQVAAILWFADCPWSFSNHHAV